MIPKLDDYRNVIGDHIINKKGRAYLEAVKESSLDNEVRAAIEDVKNPQQKTLINELLTQERTEEFTKAMIEDSNSKVICYETQINGIQTEKKSSVKSLYNNFVSYAKGTYTSIRNSTSKKIIEGPVRMTLSKFIKIFEYIQAAINPQWNMPTLSKMDYDTLSPAVTGHTILDKEDTVHNSAYVALRHSDE